MGIVGVLEGKVQRYKGSEGQRFKKNISQSFTKKTQSFTKILC
jgi:hypothetical protein